MKKRSKTDWLPPQDEITRNDTIVTKSELAALAHLPNETIEKSNVDFVETVVGSKAPGSASRQRKME